MSDWFLAGHSNFLESGGNLSVTTTVLLGRARLAVSSCSSLYAQPREPPSGSSDIFTLPYLFISPNVKLFLELIGIIKHES